MMRHTRYALRISYGVFFILLAACTPPPQPTPYIPPPGVNVPTATSPVPVYTAPPLPAAPLPSPTVQIQPTRVLTCLPVLSFIEDVTVPDGAIFSPGEPIEKIWRVRNDGNCEWDSRYRLKLVGGYDLGASPAQALFPARAGAEAELRIVFTAPAEPGTYRSAWQAHDPQGNPFGDIIYLEVTIQE